MCVQDDNKRYASSYVNEFRYIEYLEMGIDPIDEPDRSSPDSNSASGLVLQCYLVSWSKGESTNARSVAAEYVCRD